MLLLPQVQGRGFRLGLTDHTASHTLQESLTQAAQQLSLPVSIICFCFLNRKGTVSAQNPPKNLKEKYQHEEATHSLIKSVAYLALSSGFSTKEPGHCQCANSMAAKQRGTSHQSPWPVYNLRNLCLRHSHPKEDTTTQTVPGQFAAFAIKLMTQHKLCS